MGLVTDLTNITYGDRIQVQCDNPTNNPKCKGIWEICYRGKNLLTRNPFLCLSCAALYARGLKKTNPLILTPPNERICKRPVTVQCDCCRQTREVMYYGKRTEQKTSFLCSACRKISWKMNPAILTPPEQRVVGKSIRYQCKKCHGIFKATYQGKRSEEKQPYYCFHCKVNATQITTWNFAILTPPKQRKNKQPVIVQCEECKAIYTYKCYTRKLEKRIPWLCDKCSSRRQGLSNKGWKMSKEHRQKIIDANTGKKHTEETKRKIGKGNKGKVISQEQRKTLSKRQKGRKLSESWRQNIIKSRSQATAKRFITLKKQWTRKGISGYTSKCQDILYKVVRALYPDAILNDPYVIKGRLIDVTIPSIKVAIEYDGWAHFYYKKISQDVKQIKQLHAKGWRTLNYRIRGKNDIYNPNFFRKTVKQFIKSKKQHEWLVIGKNENQQEKTTEQQNHDVEQQTLFKPT